MEILISVHTGNATEQFLYHRGTSVLVHTVTEQFSIRNGAEQKPTEYSVNMTQAFRQIYQFH